MLNKQTALCQDIEKLQKDNERQKQKSESLTEKLSELESKYQSKA